MTSSFSVTGRGVRTPLWSPSVERIDSANMTRFIGFVNAKYGHRINTYDDLYLWSIDNIPEFWKCLWEFAEIKASCGFDSVVDDLRQINGARWFIGAKLNFAENLLRYRDDHPALVCVGEAHRTTRKVTYEQLYDEVARVAQSLKNTGVRSGDRIIGFLPNISETVIAMLAATSRGAIWSSCSPDFGINGVVDRFAQIEPKVLFTVDGYYYQGKRIDCLERIERIVQNLPSIERVIVVAYLEATPQLDRIPNAVLYSDFITDQETDIEFEQLGFQEPLYITYSSGTTGSPKCIVQSVGGVLLQHVKDLHLHTDVKRQDVIFYFTTCGWMMWNWLVSSLALGATVVLYDGAPLYPDPGFLWRLVEEEGITIFGTSARYLSTILKQGLKPKETHNLSTLRTVLSTGSPLSVEAFKYVYGDVKEDVQLASISGGTDINGCFALGNPLGPVYAGELQCRGLGMKVEAYNANGESVVQQRGELVCSMPCPSMPIYFWNDPNNEKYHKAYFEKFPNVWSHGDYIEIRDDGGVIIYGRSDATLNPGGVRIGTADIYRQVENIPEIADSLAVGQDWGDDERVILFVKPAEGIQLTEELKEKIRRTIRENASHRHVPAKIVGVNDIPYTKNMKKVELAVKNVIHGKEVTNTDALINPESLEFYRDLPDLRT